MPLETGVIDVCLMADVLHGFLANGEVEGVMREIARVIKKAGTLAVVDFKNVDGPPGPPLSIRLSPEEVEKMVSPYGFENMTILDIGPHHYEVILRRT